MGDIKYNNLNENNLIKLIKYFNQHLFNINEVNCVTHSLFESSIDSNRIKSSNELYFIKTYGFYIGNGNKNMKYVLISNDSKLFVQCGLLLHRISYRSLKYVTLISAFLILFIQPNAIKIYQYIIKFIINGSVDILMKIHHLTNVLLKCYPKNSHVWILKGFLLSRFIKSINKNPFFPTLRLRWLILNEFRLDYLNSDAKIYRQTLENNTLFMI